MVGNDVVDLYDPESRSEHLHPRFDTRVFTARERALIGDSREPARVRWKLWSAKEAAYKLLRKRMPTTVFSPPRFEVELVPPHGARVVHGQDQIPVGYEENAGAVHAVAASPTGRAAAVLSGWRRFALAEAEPDDAEAPSRAVRALLCQRVAERLGVDPAELEVRRRGRVPFLWVSGCPAAVDLSLSHHGDWLGFACEIGTASS